MTDTLYTSSQNGFALPVFFKPDEFENSHKEFEESYYIVEVTFLVPGAGPEKQIYDSRIKEDMECWRNNISETAAIQTGIKIIEEGVK